ncbi:MAG: branched-chain amino acid ABC transporter permease [Rhodocyclaceae bacterium]
MQLVLGGLAAGCVYALVAFGFVLIYKATETVNFAQGELMMLGAFLALALAEAGLPWWIALAGAAGLMALLGMALERLVLRPVLGRPQFSIVMLTLGLGLIARGLAGSVPEWGAQTRALPTPLSGQSVRLAGLTLAADQLLVMAVTAALAAALYAFFHGTRLGLAMRAASQNQLGACYMGVALGRMHSLAWALSAATAAVAGVLLAPVTFVHPDMGTIGLKAFPAAVIGGFGSLPGALAGGLLIGVVEAGAGFYLPEGAKDVAAYVVMLLVLMIRPSGLFGESARWRA